MIHLEDNCKTMELAVNKFMNKFDFLRLKGLPNPLVINDRLMRLEDYDKKIIEMAKEQSKNSSLKGIPIGKVLYEIFENIF